MDNYNGLIEHATDGIFIIQDGSFKLINTAMVRICGYSKEELTNILPEKLISTKSSKFSFKRSQDVLLKDNVPEICEARLVTKSGEMRDVEINAKLIEYGGRTADEIILRDITASKKMEKALREYTEKYQVLMDNVNDIFFELDNRGCFTFISPTIEKVTQFTPDEIIGLHFSRFIHPEDASGIQLGFEYNLEGRIEPRALRVKNKEGNWIYLRTTSHVRLLDNQPDGIIGVMTDVTQLSHVEDALRNSEDYFRALTENASDVLICLKEDASVQYCAPSVKKVTGYSVEEIIGQNIFKYIYAGDSLQATRLFISASSNPGYTGQIEIRLNHKDGSLRYVEIIGKNALDNPAVCGIILNIHDITAHKQIEERQKELEQELHLSSRLASIGQLAAGVAHEINNPLTSIIGFSRLMAQRELPEDIKEKVKIVHSEAQRVAHIVQGLLTFARQDELQRGYADVNEILSQILKLRSYEMEVNHITVITDLAADLPRITADAEQIQQVFLNIILNAEKEMLASHDKGVLSVKTEQNHSGIRVSVSDDGPGISPENMPKLFTPFFTTRKVGEGTGLGLSICHGIVTRHGGKIYAHSEFGHGAIFFVELPIEVEEHFLNTSTQVGIS